MSNQILVIGSTTLDRFLKIDDSEGKVVCSVDKTNCQICFNYADKIPVADFHETLGGNGANAAIGFARLGLTPAIWTVMGDDPVARLAHSIFVKEGVKTTYFEVKKEIHSTISTILHYKNDRTIFIYGKPHACPVPTFGNFPWVYITTMPEVSMIMLNTVVGWAEKNQANVIFQPGTLQLRLGIEKTKTLLAITKILILNKEEAESFTKIKGQLEKIITKIHAYGVKIVVITDGEKGAYVSDSNKLFFAGVEKINVVEKTGAGDAYASGFCSAYIQGKDIPTAMKWGLLNAQGVIGKIGPQAGILHCKKLDELLNLGQPKVVIHEIRKGVA